MSDSTLILTRAQPQAAGLRQALRDAGVQVIDFPLLQIGPPADAFAFESALRALPQTDLVIPVSPAAVQALFAALHAPWPARCAIGVVGAGSLQAVRAALQAQPGDASWPRLIAAQPLGADGEADSDALWEALQQAFPATTTGAQPCAGLRVRIVRGGPGRDVLAQRLAAAGAQVDVVEGYSRVAPPWNPQVAERLGAALRSHGWWLFTSSEAVRNLQAMLKRSGAGEGSLGSQRALAIHPRIVQAVRNAGFGRVELTAAAPDTVLSTLRRLRTDS